MGFDVLSYAIGLQAGKGNGGGSSGGGGALEPGAYFYRPDIKVKNYYQQWAEYNGEIYSFRNTASGNTDYYTIEKLVDGEWTTVIDSCSLSSTQGNMNIMFLNGKLHFVNNRNHYEFDGATVTKKSNPVNNIDVGKAAVADGKLYTYYSSGQILYEWNESADTWSGTSLGSGYKGRTLLGCGKDLYLLDDSGNLSRYENGALTAVATLNDYYLRWQPIYYNGCIYYASDDYQNKAGKLYKYDIASGAQKLVGGMLERSSNSKMSVIQNKLFVMYGDGANSALSPLFMLEVE